MKLQRPHKGTLRAVGNQDGHRIELHCFCGRWFIRRDGVTIAQNITTVRQVQQALQEGTDK